MANSIAGTLSVNQSVDHNGSLSIDIPLQVPHAKIMPALSLAYHSAASAPSLVGLGWVIKGASQIERVPATLAQDGFRGVVNYNQNDRFALDGQRLIRLAPNGNEYRFEVENWSKIIAVGDPTNPDSWVEHLPDGTKRTFGATTDSNIKAQGGTTTRVWAISDHSDTFTNYVSFAYNNDTPNGSFYLMRVGYGGNRRVAMAHQRELLFEYEYRPDIRVRYLGGHRIRIDKRLASVTSRVQTRIVHKHILGYDVAPLTGVSRLRTLTLADPSGATVRPLNFDWTSGQPLVFDPVRAVATINAGTTAAQIIPMDVNGSGRSDIVIASRRLDPSIGAEGLYIAVHRADGQGGISQSPSPGSGFTGLHYPTQLLPLDVNGDGKADMLHITSSLDGSHTLTVLLSTLDGYKRQQSQRFVPESTGGRFYAGDFEGNGRIGLVYVYQILSGTGPQLKFIQFTSNGVQFTALSPSYGPTGFTLDQTSIVVGDLSGKGAEDVFLISRKLKGSSYVCHINLVESVNDRLTYRADGPLVSSGESVPWTSSTAFLPYAADEDGKTSLLAVSSSLNGQLQWQLLRSTGPSFLPAPPPTTTQMPYNGNVALVKTLSTHNVDLVNTFDSVSGIQVHVLRFDSEKFIPIGAVRQPDGVSPGSSVRWADLRGVGRADCTLNTFNVSGNVTIHSMPCSSLQPIDFISGYRNGIGARTAALYAPLSDPEVYTATDAALTATTAAVNAMARNVASSVSLTPSAPAQDMGHSRAQVVHFPAFVVKTLYTSPHTALPELPEVLDQRSYKYRNARLAFDGRGWLGFESIARLLQPLGTIETISYHQTFPLLGQVSRAVTSEMAGGYSLQTNDYTWVSTLINNGRNHSILLQSCRESYYEANVYSFAVNVTYQHDSYANITQLDITSSQPNVPALSINSTYDNNAQSWVIGNKTLEVVRQQALVLKQTSFTYVSGTRISSATSNWVTGSVWSTQSFEFDQTGNEIVVRGPGQSRRLFSYDATYSNPISSSTFTGPDDSSALRESAVYDMALGKPLSITDANGHIISRSYDVLGRVRDISQGTSLSGMTVVERRSFHFEGDKFFESRQVKAGNSYWSTTTAYFDGFERPWRTETPRPDNLSAMIRSELRYNGAGQITARSRDYLAGSTPVFSTYTYDTRSRLIREVAPAAAVGVSPITTTFQYKFESGLAKIIETRAGGAVATQVFSREILHFPSPQPSAGQFVKPFVTRLINELGQSIRTVYDGLGRSVSVKDPSNIELSLVWDGLSRQIQRRLLKPEGSTFRVTSHHSVRYEDDISQHTVRNELTGSATITKTDYAQRPIFKTNADETLTFTYDKGGEYSKERLVNVMSSKGIEQHFDYDVQGHLTRARLSLDGHAFITSHEWTATGQLLRTTNPDGTTITRSFLADGETIGHIALADTNRIARASVTLSGYNNAFSRPQVCEFGNGMRSVSTLAHNGSLTNTSISRGGGVLHQQDWKIDAFSRIGEYKVSHASLPPINSSFQYDTAGQLVHRVSDPSTPGPETFSYDQSGSLSSKDGKAFRHDGWQLTSILNQQGATEYSFKYSVDGNRTAKLDGRGAEISVMKYDTNGRLVELDRTAFVYDFGGRLIKSVLPNGDVTIYPSQTYEVSIPVSGSKSHVAYLVHGYRRASLTTEESSGKFGPPIVYYFHNDHLGSTIAASSETGEIVTRYRYDAFGKVTVEGRDVARYKYSGKELFGGLYHFGARFYDPDTARFLTLDDYPISLRHITPSTFNMYAFSRNDPINFIDLNGNVPWWHWFVDVALIAAGTAISFMTFGMAGIIGGAILGAGMNGLLYDIDATISSNGAYKDSDWAIQLGIGAGLGLLSGGIGAAVDAVFPAATIINAADAVQAAGARGIATALSRTGGLLGRAGLRVAALGGVGSLTGVLGQVATNAVNHRPLGEGLGKAAWMGAIAGVATQIAFEGIAFAKPSLQFWKERQWGTYGVSFERSVEASTIRGLDWRGPVSRVEYPPAHVGSEIALPPHTPSLDSGSIHSLSLNSSSIERHIPAYQVTSL